MELRAYIWELLERKPLTLRDLATLMGKLVAADPGNKWARIKSKTIVRALNWGLRDANGNFGAACTLTRQVKESLQFWLENLGLTHRDYAQRLVVICAYTDASLQGWGKPTKHSTGNNGMTRSVRTHTSMCWNSEQKGAPWCIKGRS